MNELQKVLEEYPAVRRAFGFKLYMTESLLRKFVIFAEQEGVSFISRDLALRWAMQPEGSPAWWARRLREVRLFALYRSATDPRTEIPLQGMLPYRYRRKQPYIYSDGEIRQIIRVAKELPSIKGLRSHTYSTLFGLLVVTGMRTSEIIGLNCEDVDLSQGILTIREAKFGKSRLVFIHPSTQNVLKQYVHQRDQLYSKPKTKSFFVSDSGSRLTAKTVQCTFAKLSHHIGLRGPNDSYGPRLHDFRHGFAIRTLLNWYRAGVNVEQHMPELSTYLGHVHVSDTYWYISAIPELLKLAAMRVENMKGGWLV